MAAPLGNKNAIGNSGGKSSNDRKTAAEVRMLALNKIRLVLLGEDSDFQRQVLLRLASNVLPRIKEPAGEESVSLQLNFDSTFNEKRIG